MTATGILITSIIWAAWVIPLLIVTVGYWALWKIGKGTTC